MARDPATNSPSAAPAATSPSHASAKRIAPAADLPAPETQPSSFAPDLAWAPPPSQSEGAEAAAEPANYRRAFWTSRQHIWLAALTLGLGVLSGQRLGLLIGATLYALGLIFVPDFAFFRRAVDLRIAKAAGGAQQARVLAYQQRRDQLVRQLSKDRRARHDDLEAICADVETAIQPEGASDPDRATRHQKLEEIGWTYLRLLTTEQGLDRYLDLENAENVPKELSALQDETKALAAEVQSMTTANPRPVALDDKQRLLTSRLERLKSLEERVRRIGQAQTKHDYLRSEEDGLVDKVKLIRADAMAGRNIDSLTARLDGSLNELSALNKWLSEISELDDLNVQVPRPPTAG